MKTNYRLTNGYPLKVRLTGEKVGRLLLVECLETCYGYTKGEIIKVSNLWLFDKL